MKMISEWEHEFGTRVRSARRQQGYTQAQLAERANVSVSALKRLESGTGSTLSTLISVVRALEMTAELDAFLSAANTVSPMAMLRRQRGRQ